MLILKPTTDVQTITIAPRNSRGMAIYNSFEQRVPFIESEACLFNKLTLPLIANLREDGYNETESFEISSVSMNGNFVNVNVEFTILNQDKGYYLEIFNGDVLWYRDKIYVTNQTDFKDGYSISSDKYDTYNQNENDTYIING